MNEVMTDVTIIGAGLAGLYTALNIDEQYKVVVINKGDGKQSSSILAQGGIAACIHEEDTIEGHVNDTMVAGSFRNDKGAVEELVRGAARQVKHLIELGVDFDKDEDGQLKATLEGGHRFRRVLHSDGDATGKAVMKKVGIAVEEAGNIQVENRTAAIQLILNNEKKVMGLLAVKDGELLLIKSKIVVIATGGVGALYMNTTNPNTLTGDGLALAHDAGATIKDGCLVQFHPTALYLKGVKKHFLITEAMRGEGAILRNQQKEAFMSKYDQRKELAPRDIVSRAIFYEMKKSDTPYVWLDITHRSKEFLMNRFPNIYEELAGLGIHIEKDFIPVAPVAHYYVGGIKAGIDGKTNVDHLYACGEVASTGVHGGNRLASNSLLECVVFGEDCGRAVSRQLKQLDKWDLSEEKYILSVDENKLSSTEDDDEYDKIIEACKKYMSSDVAIIRQQEGLVNVYTHIVQFERQIRWKTQSVKWFETKNALTASRLIIEDALSKDSIGCHYKDKKNEVAI